MNNTQQPKTNNLPEWYEIEFKKQADRIAELEKQLDLHKNAHHKAVEILREKTKPLSDEEMEDIESRVYAKTISKGKPMGIYAKTLCRAIEERILRK